jgi:hypothetical protein
MSWTRAAVAAGIKSSLGTTVTVVVVAATWPDRTLATTLTMDDLPNQPVDGLVHPSGVEFGFTVGGVPDLDARYNAFGPGSITYVQDPSIEGTTAGVLEVILPGAFPSVEFGLAVSGYQPTSVSVELFDAANTSLGVLPLFLNPLVLYDEGQFVHNGVGVLRILVDMTPAQGSGAFRFAYDNLTFVPEPATAMLIAAGLAGFAMRRRRDQVS